MKKIISLILLLLLPKAVLSQTTVVTGPVDVTMKLAWEAPVNIITVADALTFEYRLRDGSFIPVTALTLVTCIGTPISCQSNLTQSNVDALNRVGQHSLTLSAFRLDVGDSSQSLPFILKTPASAPINPRIIR